MPGALLLAQRTLDIAGDTFDRVLMNLIMKKARHVRGEKARGLFWRALVPQIRALKEAIVADGFCTLDEGGKTIKVKLKEMMGRPDFKKAMKDIDAAYLAALDEISGAALEAGHHEIAIVLAGGGANYPFLQALAARPKPAKVIVRAKGDAVPNLDPPLAFPLAIQLVNDDTALCFDGRWSALEKNELGLAKGKP